MIDLGDVVTDDEMDELFFIQYIENLERAAVDDILRRLFDIGSENISTAIELSERDHKF